MKIPKVNLRRLYDAENPDGYEESDMEYLENNREAAVWFLDNRDAIASLIAKGEKLALFTLKLY